MAKRFHVTVAPSTALRPVQTTLVIADVQQIEAWHKAWNDPSDPNAIDSAQTAVTQQYTADGFPRLDLRPEQPQRATPHCAPRWRAVATDLQRDGIFVHGTLTGQASTTIPPHLKLAAHVHHATSRLTAEITAEIHLIDLPITDASSALMPEAASQARAMTRG